MIQGRMFHKGTVLSKDVNNSIPHFDCLSIFDKYIQKTFVKVYICLFEIAPLPAVC